MTFNSMLSIASKGTPKYSVESALVGCLFLLSVRQMPAMVAMGRMIFGLLILTLASGKKVSTEVLLKRIEHLEEQMAIKGEAAACVTSAQLEQRLAEVAVKTVAVAETPEVSLTRAEIHQRFHLYHEAQAKELLKVQEQLVELRAQMQGLQSALLEKAQKNQVMSRAEIHERFRIFYTATTAASDQRKQEVSGEQVMLPELKNGPSRCESSCVDAMSRAEVHERFRLFQQALAREAATGPPASTCMNCSSSSPPDVLEVPAASSSSWMSWIFTTGMMCAGATLGLLSLCEALGESKAQEDRLAILEQRFEDSKMMILATSTAAADAQPGLGGKWMSGAAGAAVGSTTGAISGSLAGGAFGAVAGLVPAVFTFGLSIPLGAAMGSSLGLVAGSMVGGGTGAVGGVRAANWYKARQSS